MSAIGELRDAGPGGNQEERRNVLTTAISVMLADGDEADVEADLILRLGAVSPILAGMEEADFRTIVREVKNEIMEHGHDGAIARSANAISAPLRETALCFAMLVTLADGEIDDGEVTSLTDLAGTLGISDAEFDHFFKAMLALKRLPEN
jgi:tellurite resistance protein